MMIDKRGWICYYITTLTEKVWCVVEQIKELVWKIWEAGQHDPEYAMMLAELGPLEKKYDAVLQTLSMEQQDVVCDFVSQCEAMSWRMLEFACEQLTKTPGA